MKIVVLDGFTLNPGDLSWEELKKLGDVTIYDRTPVDKVVERSIHAEVVLTNKAILGSEQIKQLPHLRYIGVMATGYNVVDVETARKQGITVTNVSGYSTDSVAQHVFALLLALVNQVTHYDRLVRKGDWHSSKDFSFWDSPIHELKGKVMGIIGFGSIGRRTGELAKAFGMKVISYHKHPERDKEEWVDFHSLEHVFSSSDVISLHCPLNIQNKGFVDIGLLNKMKADSILINTARGPLINHDDLAKALQSGTIKAAALDVFDEEPPLKNHPIFNLKNCLITPHQAWATQEARKRLMSTIVSNIDKYNCNNPENVVS